MNRPIRNDQSFEKFTFLVVAMHLWYHIFYPTNGFMIRTSIAEINSNPFAAYVIFQDQWSNRIIYRILLIMFAEYSNPATW